MSRRPGVARILLVLFAASSVWLAAPASSDAEGRNPMAQPELEVDAFRWQGEEFYYSIRLNGAEAMRASVRAGNLRKANNRAYVPISGLAQSVGFFNNIYPLQDRAHSFVDPQSFRPLRSEKRFEERGETRTYKVDYVHSTYRAKVEKSKENRTFKFHYSIPGTTHDMISWMYDLRAREDFGVGDEFSFYIYDGWKLSHVELKVVAKEDVYTPMGWFKGWKLDFQRKVLRSSHRRGKDGQPQKPLLRVKTPDKHSGHLWLSRDENRLPIKVSIDTKLGTSEALLVKYKPAEKQ